MKIDVITVKLTYHAPIDRSNAAAVLEVYRVADDLLAAAPKNSQPTIDKRLNRVTAPEVAPEASAPADDNLEPPENLRRKPKGEQAAAE